MAMATRWGTQVRMVVGALGCVAVTLMMSSPAAAQPAPGRFARLAVLRPHDGRTTDFEAGYIRHLEFHRHAKDPWRWFGWTVWAGDRQRSFIYATFSHAATDFDQAVGPAEDERDNVLNVTPHAQFAGNAIYEFLPRVSRGSGEPSPSPRLELTTVDVQAGMGAAFEAAVAPAQASLSAETLWYRLVSGGRTPRYVRLRPRASLATVLNDEADAALPEAATRLVEEMTVEILNLRPTMSYGLARP
jgi:hypothetical protein